MKRLAIVTTHPIQYNAPWFKLLAESKVIQPKIFYTWEQSAEGNKYDPGFGKEVKWDIPLLEGYDYTFVKNISTQPGTHHYKGIINPTLNAEIEEWQADAILVFGWNFVSHLKCIRYFHKKTPVIFRGDSTLLDKQVGLKKVLRFLFLKWVYKHVNYCLYVGSNNKKYFQKYGLKDDQLILAPHAIDNVRFAGADKNYESEAAEWRLKLGIKKDDIVLLFAGKLDPKKNPGFLFEIARQVRDNRLKIILAGNGILENVLKQQAAKDERIIFIDFQNQQKMPVVYRLGDLFILPSIGPGETWGLCINEAMACGLPVIISNKVGCGDDLVKNNKNGIIFEINAAGSVVSFLNEYLDNKLILKKMGGHSTEIIKDFSFHQIVRAIEELLLRL